MNKIFICFIFLGFLSCNNSKEISFSEIKNINGAFYNNFIKSGKRKINATEINSFYPTGENSSYYKSEVIFSNQEYYAFLIAAHDLDEQVLQIITKNHQEELQGTLTLFYENSEACWNTSSKINPKMEVDIFSFNCMKEGLSKTDTLQNVILENGKVI